MKSVVFTEKEAEDFLEKNGFDVVKRVYVNQESDINNAIKLIGFPVVMKISGESIIHKNKVGGIKLNIKSYEEAEAAFREFKKNRGFEGVMVEEQLSGKEFLLGIKETPEFGHVIAFGAGGIHTEKLKDISFRVCPFDKPEAHRMMNEVKFAYGLDKNDSDVIIKNIIKLCTLIRKFPDIAELDINPLMVESGKAIIADTRVLWNRNY
jgi:succinyl-CoA synthetase beta subunit